MKIRKGKLSIQLAEGLKVHAINPLYGRLLELRDPPQPSGSSDGNLLALSTTGFFFVGAGDISFILMMPFESY